MNESLVNEYAAYGSKVQDFVLRHFTPDKTLPDGSKNPEDNPGVRAEVMSAALCMVSIARIFHGCEVGRSEYILPVAVDLTFGLDDNGFWRNRKDLLVPAYRDALMAYLNGNMMRLLPDGTPNKEAIIERQTKIWHNLFITAYAAIFGTTKAMQKASVMLQELLLLGV